MEKYIFFKFKLTYQFKFVQIYLGMSCQIEAYFQDSFYLVIESQIDKNGPQNDDALYSMRSHIYI